jgi:hypothetical protein
MTDVENPYETDGLELVEGERMKPLFGDGAMLNLLEFEPGCNRAGDNHPHEEPGIIWTASSP